MKSSDITRLRALADFITAKIDTIVIPARTSIFRKNPSAEKLAVSIFLIKTQAQHLKEALKHDSAKDVIHALMEIVKNLSSMLEKTEAQLIFQTIKNTICVSESITSNALKNFLPGKEIQPAIDQIIVSKLETEGVIIKKLTKVKKLLLKIVKESEAQLKETVQKAQITIGKKDLLHAREKAESENLFLRKIVATGCISLKELTEHHELLANTINTKRSLQNIIYLTKQETAKVLELLNSKQKNLPFIFDIGREIGDVKREIEQLANQCHIHGKFVTDMQDVLHSLDVLLTTPTITFEMDWKEKDISYLKNDEVKSQDKNAVYATRFISQFLNCLKDQYFDLNKIQIMLNEMKYGSAIFNLFKYQLDSRINNARIQGSLLGIFKHVPAEIVEMFSKNLDMYDGRSLALTCKDANLSATNEKNIFINNMEKKVKEEEDRIQSSHYFDCL